MRGVHRLVQRLAFLLGLALVMLATGCHPRVPQPLLNLQGQTLPERHIAPTDDGWSLALFHYPAWFRTPGHASSVETSGQAATEAAATTRETAAVTTATSGTGAGEAAAVTTATSGTGAGEMAAVTTARSGTGAVETAAERPGAERTLPPLSRDPVILCHGLAANHYSWDLTEERSLARFLADRGYDVWILDLRGHGDSKPTRGVKRKRDRDGWGFDEYALHDVPAAISYVRQATGASQVNWVGHSMGGMIIYAWLASSGATTVRNVVAIGSPGSLDFANDLIELSLGGMRFIQWAPRVGSRRGARLWSHIGGRIIGGFEETIWHLDNMSPDAARLMFWEGVENIERGVERSFAAIGESGKLVSRDRKTDYQAQLPRFSAPLLAIAGKLDGLATPLAVQRLFDQVGSRDKTYELISRANGYSYDYGHVDLIIGDRAKQDVYPLVYRWLEKRQPSAGQVVTGMQNP